MNGKVERLRRPGAMAAAAVLQRAPFGGGGGGGGGGSPRARQDMMAPVGLDGAQFAVQDEHPPPLIGASTTVVNGHLYTYGGYIASREPPELNEKMYVMSLETFVWKMDWYLEAGPSPPPARCFHSASACGHYLVIFGGLGNLGMADKVLYNDVLLYNTQSRVWRRLAPNDPAPGACVPEPRFAHLAAVSEGRLVIIGGQRDDHSYRKDVAVFDLAAQRWLAIFDIEREIGAYRSAVATRPDCECSTVQGERSISDQADDLYQATLDSTRASLSHPTSPNSFRTINDACCRSPISLYIFSNKNFSQIERHLYRLTITFDPEMALSVEEVGINFQGHGSPGLRFPSACLYGNHIILSGIYLGKDAAELTLWKIDLDTFTFGCAFPGSNLSIGSWSRGLIDADQSILIIVGHGASNPFEDYKRRVSRFNHVVIFDLNCFDHVPNENVAITSALTQLGNQLLDETRLSDMSIWTKDHTLIACSSYVLASRWIYFLKLSADEVKDRAELPVINSDENQSLQKNNANRVVYFPYNHDVCHALLRFLYTASLPCEGQVSIETLTSLFSLSHDYIGLERLSTLTAARLGKSLSHLTAKAILRTAISAGHKPLQFRASRWLEQNETVGHNG